MSINSTPDDAPLTSEQATTQPGTPEAPNPDPARDDEFSQAGSGFGNAETAVGGADSVPDDPDVNTRQSVGGGPGSGDGPGAGLSAAENDS